MEKIQHSNIKVNNISMHIAQIHATNPTKKNSPIIFIHGFPELWYTWRHQMTHLSSLGYHTIAPDLRGYGDTSAPVSASEYTFFHIVGDLVGLLDHLGLDKVFVVGHDWGAMIAWYFCLLRPDRVKALVNMSVVFSPRNPVKKPVETMRKNFGSDYYICRFQEPGVVEAEFARVDTALLIKKFLTSRNPGLLCVPKEVGFGGNPNSKIPLPSWLSEDDVNYFASKFRRTGFTGGLNYYRAMDLNWELTAAWTGEQIKVPVKFIVGDLDLTYNTPGVKDFIHKGGLRKHVPFLQELVVMEGVAHYINQERPREVSEHIYDFIKKF